MINNAHSFSRFDVDKRVLSTPISAIFADTIPDFKIMQLIKVVLPYLVNFGPFLTNFVH